MFEKLLVLYDFSPSSQQALEWAVRLAARTAAALKVVHVTSPLPGAKAQMDLAEKIRRNIDREVGILAQKAEGELRELEVDIGAGDPAASILRTIKEDAPDLVILGTHGRTGIARIVMGSVAEKVVRHSPFPVFVARKASSWPPRSVLVPIDWDESAEEALLLASDLSRTFPIRVELIHVLTPVTPLVYANDLPPVVPYFDEAAAKREAEEKLKALAMEHPRMSMVSHVTVGNPAAEICQKAQDIKADLILIPTYGRKGFSRFFMGSVAEQVVRYAPCHVLNFCPAKGMAERQRFLEEIREKSVGSELR